MFGGTNNLKLTWLGLGAVLVSTATATPTALNVIPIADTLKHREAVLNYTVTGQEAKISKQYAHGNFVQVGLLDKLELGYDNDFNGNTFLNGKLNVMDGDQKFLKGVALSVGVTGVKGKNVDPYVVARKDFGKLRIHGGWWRVAKVNSAIWGADYEVSDAVTLMVDHISGTNNYTYVGLYTDVPAIKGLNIGAAMGFNGNKANGKVHLVSVSYGFRF
jgi:hypothetical protein